MGIFNYMHIKILQAPNELSFRFFHWKNEPSQDVHAWKRHAPKSIGNKAFNGICRNIRMLNLGAFPFLFVQSARKNNRLQKMLTCITELQVLQDDWLVVSTWQLCSSCRSITEHICGKHQLVYSMREIQSQIKGFCYIFFLAAHW